MLSLRSSLMLIFVLLVAAPLGVFWAWPHSKALQNELDDVRDRHLLLARNLGTALQRYHRDISSAFEFVAESLQAKRVLPESSAMLANLRFRSVCLFDAQSLKLVRGQNGLSHCPETALAETMALIPPAALEGQTVVTPVHRGRDGVPLIAWTRRLGKYMAIGAIDTRYFVDTGKSISFGARGHAVIVDQTGKVLAHPFTTWEQEMRDLSAISAVTEMRQGNTGITSFYSPAFKDDMIAGYTSVAGPGWGVMVPQPISELRETARQIQNSALSLFAMSLLAAALIAYRAAFTLIEPVSRLIDGAGAMARGALNIRVPQPGRLAPAELAQLTTTFNAMAESVHVARSGEAEAREAAERANRSKTDFLRTVTHELRSPLNAIVGFTDMLATGKVGAPGSREATSCVEDIRSGAKLLLSLTNDLLDLARIEAGQYKLADDMVDFWEIADRARRFAEPAAMKRGTSIAVEISQTFPALRGDERALFQCILNLVSNAVKYGRDNGTIRLYAEQVSDGGIKVIVADDGPGISDEDIDRVLEPFQRVASTANAHTTGTGLGLPIVKKLVELHDGAFTLESRLGSGTKANLSLPAARVIDDNQGFLVAAE